MHEAPAATPGGPGPGRRALRRSRVWVIVAVVLALGAAVGVRAAIRGGPAAPPAAAAAVGTAWPSGTYTLPGGRQARLASLRGHPVLVWFVAAGCASCAASVPAVAAHLGAFAKARTRILVLGLYGAFGQGAAGAAQLTGFGKAAAGKAFASPVWTWGLASERLTAALDPSGTPDAYLLLDPAGHVTYQDSVPVSTMSALLARLPAASG